MPHDDKLQLLTRLSFIALGLLDLMQDFEEITLNNVIIGDDYIKMLELLSKHFSLTIEVFDRKKVVITKNGIRGLFLEYNGFNPKLVNAGEYDRIGAFDDFYESDQFDLSDILDEAESYDETKGFGVAFPDNEGSNSIELFKKELGEALEVKPTNTVTTVL